MKERPCVITVWPSGRELRATSGDSLYTLLLVAGIIRRDDPASNRLRLERGTVSPSTDPAAEAEAFTAAELTEGWILASCRRIQGDAELMQGSSVDADPAQPLGSGFGLIVAVGTATLGCGLVALGGMEIPMLSACPNSQLRLATDMSERIAYYNAGPQNALKMAAFLRNDIARMTERLVSYTEIDHSRITTVTMVGRPPLLRMLRGMDPLAAEECGHIRRLRAGDMQLQPLPETTDLYLLPAADRDAGSDTVASVLAAGLLEKVDDERISILIDTGISCEVVAVGRGRMLCCSVATAPLEGVGVSCGMQSVSGAVYSVEISDTVTVHTIHDEAAKGLCGAGLLSAVHQLAEQEMIGEDGRLRQPEDLPDELADRFRATASGMEFVLVRVGQGVARDVARDVCVNQEDVRKLQLAKGAVRAACHALLAELDAGVDDIDVILIAEAYRANINTEAALELGLLPPVEKDKVRSIGNADWQGAYLVLTDRDNAEKAERIAGLLTRLDLAANHVYAAEFIKAMNF
ncbi:MAG: DUF4445 domain-containing protein [Firmicutes bacterium]|nr:DUF4445 domain-containing protein [Bacillota bacterium]